MAEKIPKGKVSTTYKAMAKKLNCRAYRAVGNALNKNKSKGIPCRQIINSNDSIGGFNQGIQEKIKLLRKECIEIKKGKISLKSHGIWLEKSLLAEPLIVMTNNGLSDNIANKEEHLNESYIKVTTRDNDIKHERRSQ